MITGKPNQAMERAATRCVFNLIRLGNGCDRQLIEEG